MNMESTRRPFDRSKEPGLKKPRLAEENQRVPNPNLNGRPFSQRPAGNNPVQSRLGASDRDSENNDSLGGSYHPQPPHHELVSQYKTALAELTFNSKPIITNLTIIAGENLPVAKAIAATVCANILEVPSEQKLPSLYLLDSIVKNIGRDYIKYFATKLPEVFCKAYRQVDPAVHPSMRHLFGTWKGVFPPQSLQMIEKELGFATAVNGSSTGSTNSKPDSQAHCPPHSIHVNPKYLERQRLQQPSRTKGMSIDITGPEINSLEDSDRLDKATSAGRPWFDPSVKMHNMQRSHRDTISEHIHEKNIRSEDDDCNYVSDLSKKPGSEIGKTGKRVVEQGYNKPWYGGGSSVPEPITSQRNGLKIKQGFQNHSAFDPNLRTVQNIANKSSGTMSSSWKNSDEEEFMWDDMNSRLTDHSASDVSSSLKKHHWTIDDSDKLGLEDFEKPPIVHDYSSNKDLAALGHQVSAQSLQKSNSMHEWSQSRTPLVRDHPQGYAAVSRLSTIGNSSLARMGGRPPMVASSHVGGSSFGFPTNTIGGSVEAPVQHRLQSLGAGSSSEPLLIRQHSPLPRPTLIHPHHQLQSLTEQDSPEAKSFDHAYSKASHFSGKLLKETQNQYYQESPVVPPSNVQLRSMEKSQLQGIKASSPSVPAFLSGHHYTSAHLEDSPLSDPSDEIQKSPLPQISDIGTFSSSNYAPISTNPLAAEISRESNTSSLLAAVMKSGILNSNSTSSSSPNLNFQETEKFPSGHIPLSTEPSLSSSYNSSAVPEISQNNVGQPQSLTSSSLSVGASGDASDVNNGPNPISNLLSSLVAKGLIGASKTELPNVLPSQVPNESKRKSPEITITSTVSATADPSVSSIVLSTKNVAIPSEPPAAKTHSIITQSSKLEIKNVVGFEFKSDVLRKFHPSVIEDLLDNYPHQCSICGLKFKFQEQFNRHLEWHSIKKSEYIKVSRRWYVESSDWISGKAGLPLGFESAKSVEKPGQTKEKGELMVPADEIQCACVLCGEIFEDFYCQERDEWMFMGAVYMTIPSGAGDRGSTSEAVVKGPIVHADCISESSLLDLGLVSSIKMEEDA